MMLFDGIVKKWLKPLEEKIEKLNTNQLNLEDNLGEQLVETNKKLTTLIQLLKNSEGYDVSLSKPVKNDIEKREPEEDFLSEDFRFPLTGDLKVEVEGEEGFNKVKIFSPQRIE